jgi:NAD+ diphosphatase
VVFNGEPIGDHPAIRLGFGEYVGKDLEPASIGPVMPYSGRWLDRAGGRRRDPEWVAASRTAPGARVLPLWRDQCLVAGDPPAPLILPAAASAAVLAAADEVAFLGLDGSGGVFAADLSSVEQAAAISLAGADGAADIRSMVSGPELALAANLAYARGLLHWARNHRFCGTCGATSSREGGHVRVCDKRRSSLRSSCWWRPRVHRGGVCWPATKDPQSADTSHSPASSRSARAWTTPCAGNWPRKRGCGSARQPMSPRRRGRSKAGIMIGFRVAAADDTVMVDGEELVEARWFTRAELLEHRASGRRLGRRIRSTVFFSGPGWTSRCRRDEVGSRLLRSGTPPLTKRGHFVLATHATTLNGGP